MPLRTASVQLEIRLLSKITYFSPLIPVGLALRGTVSLYSPTLPPLLQSAPRSVAPHLALAVEGRVQGALKVLTLPLLLRGGSAAGLPTNPLTWLSSSETAVIWPIGPRPFTVTCPLHGQKV